MHGDEMQLTEDRGNLLENSGIQEEFKQSRDKSHSTSSSLQRQILKQIESDESERGRSDAGGGGNELNGTNERYDEGSQRQEVSPLQERCNQEFLIKKETNLRKLIDDEDMFT